MATEQLLSSSLDNVLEEAPRNSTYGDYLELTRLLSSQKPRSTNPNEVLFIIQHQVSELWMKLLLHELCVAQAHIEEDRLRKAIKSLERISRIFTQLTQAWGVLETLSPLEYREIRPFLGTSSGFQSYQFREMEFILGNKNISWLTSKKIPPEAYKRLQTILYSPSLYDEVVKLLARRHFTIASERLGLDWTLATIADTSVKTAWKEIYRNPDQYWELYELAEKLVDLESAFRYWRFCHATTVGRVIGFKAGTSGSSGVTYLNKTVSIVLFPELIAVRTEL